jgi:predicted dehydrogenase
MPKIGIIGAGMIAEKHMKSIQKSKRMDVKWLADIVEAKLQKMKDEYDIPYVTVNYKDILNDKEIDAVLICTPPNLHKEMFIESLKAEKHVFLEKPAAMNLQEIDEMIAFQKQFPQLIVCDCSARHSRLQPRFQVIKDIIKSGTLGDIYYIHHNSIWRNGRPGIEYHPEAKWFLDKSIAGGGPLFDWGVYDLSFHLGILDDKHELDSVSDVMLKSGLDSFDPGENVYDVEEMFTVQMKLSGGLRYSWERGNHANMNVPNETRIYGTRAGLKFGSCSWDEPLIHLYDYDGEGKARHTEIAVNDDGHSDDEALISHLCDLLDGKAKPAMPLGLARKHLDIIWKCYAKAEEVM